MKRLLCVVVVVCLAGITRAQWATQADQMPAFHAGPPAKGEVLPAVLTQKQLAAMGASQPVQTESYKAAAKIPAVFHQLPCYCYCDRAHGHKSLHSCFESTHGANCGVCMGEALYAYKMTKKGWSPKMIREGIIRGDYKLMDLQHPEPVN
jgi:Protein of unknown function with PCYCGC motif